MKLMITNINDIHQEKQAFIHCDGVHFVIILP